jgi:hypothetical protein
MENIYYIYNLNEIDINNWKEELFKYKKYKNFGNK